MEQLAQGAGRAAEHTAAGGSAAFIATAGCSLSAAGDSCRQLHQRPDAITISVPEGIPNRKTFGILGG
jgi:hypothetical protein